ncbi:11942_t:CDS:2 [Funneliformis mosseae]|uniref:11942_t:CDS:1 n=1 Tax=Funneliformis mosseae TaxID=27381 RepID=A0A9N9HPF8_FUNMO|nr:11942_t:CDS:2 [Funneliformis mosseae]
MGPGGLAFSDSIQKNHNTIEKKFNVKIFNREPSPQGTDVIGGKVIYYITLHERKSFLKCIPESIDTRLHEVVPDPIDGGIENHVVTVHDHLGNVLFKTPGYQVKNVYELGIDVQWDKKCVGYHENEEGVWVIFEDGTRGRGDFLVGADGIHSAIRKQKIPELISNHLGITQCCTDVAPNKELFDRILSITGNNSSNAINESSRYRVSFGYSYPSEQHEKDDNWTYKDYELSTSKFPDDEILKWF